MSQQEYPKTGRLALSTRSVLLLVLIVGLGAGVVAYSVGNTLAANVSQSSQSTQATNGYVPLGPRGFEKGAYYEQNRTGTRLGFRAVSTINNVTVTGFSIADSNHITVSLSWGGSGSAPAVTIVSVAASLSGSNTLAAGWTSPSTVSVNMVGTGTLSSSSTCLRVVVVPLTGS